MTLPTAPIRTGLFADPEGKFIHDVVLDSCRKHGDKIAIVDTSCTPPRRISYAEYGDLVERTARGLVAAGIRPGDMIGIYLPNCWEFGVAFHAATLAGAIPTTMNPTYRDREVHHQMETSEAVALISDGPLLDGIRPVGSASAAKGVHRPDRRTRRVRAAQQPFTRHDVGARLAGAATRLATDDRDASLLQRHDRIAEGRDALASQHRRQCLPDTDGGRSWDVSTEMTLSCVFSRCTTSTDLRSD